MQISDNRLTEHGLDSRNEDDIDILDLATALAKRWRVLVIAPLVVGVVTLGISFLLTPTYTARTVFLPPQQQQSSAVSAIASLGALAGLAGGSVKTPGDQYVALMQSANIKDRIIDRFKLMEVYEVKYRFLAQRELESNVRITLGKKDGLITLEADASNPDVAAAMANQYVEELRRLTATLALTEAQQRRVFFENEVKRTKLNLAEAQQALQASGFNSNALKTEPKAAAEGFARLKAEATTAEVKLQTMRRSLADGAPEVQQQTALLAALKSQLERMERTTTEPKEDADYIGRYREFKYQEALYELFSKQYEAARLDESREGGPLQVVDVATPPERKTKPKRAALAIAAAAGTGVALALYFLCQLLWSRAQGDPARASKIERLRKAW
ncbi:Wzz/FepE/Etk N-terminal domain-containing protein [Pelomonas sp. KK5]|uniref:Wzz/FepE/Etk N-terminal domain-containing protein n=1 Tax=Pelomonas sp. KK5 TaxID=1855730 RepID=UPI00097C789D|nr:Wzz/FepE/Etk N-terminal domain-containing protein [Pelomonas sp. KK5]